MERKSNTNYHCGIYRSGIGGNKKHYPMRFIHTKPKRMGASVLVADTNGAVIAILSENKTNEVCELKIGEAAEITYIENNFQITLKSLPWKQ